MITALLRVIFRENETNNRCRGPASTLSLKGVQYPPLVSHLWSLNHPERQRDAEKSVTQPDRDFSRHFTLKLKIFGIFLIKNVKTFS